MPLIQIDIKAICMQVQICVIELSYAYHTRMIRSAVNIRGILRGNYCTFDNLTKYVMLPGNGSVCFTFHTYDKYHTRIIRTCDSKASYVSYVHESNHASG